MQPACSVPHRIRIRNAVSKSSGKLGFGRRVVLHHTHTQPVAILDQHRGVVVQVEQRRGVGALGGYEYALAAGVKRSEARDSEVVTEELLVRVRLTC